MDSRAIDQLAADTEGEFPFDPALYVFHLAVAMGRVRDAQLERELKAVGLSLARHRALTVLLRFEPCTMTELADYSAVDRTTLTRIVDQLVRDRHVERAAKAEDRRQVLLLLTPSGRDVANEARDVVARHNRKILAGVPDSLVRAMVRAQQMILTNLAPGEETLHRLLTLNPKPPESQPGSGPDQPGR
jgi:DNA-binding MarR family transcriptional regulator